MADAPEIPEAAARAAVARTVFMDGLWAREGVDGLCPGEDYADSRGPLVSPRVIRERLLPGMRTHVEAAHAKGLPVLKHACGNNWKIMDILLEAGYDAYQSIQESATMDITQLKREYGDRITLWGGVNTETLIAGTPDDIRGEVRRAIKHCAPGGGFILGSSHSILIGAQYPNYMAMLDEARKAGRAATSI
jgi:uroporphyrinogen-III decarboxylase